MKDLMNHTNAILIRDPDHMPYDLFGDASMRQMVKHLVEVHHLPIASCNKGYHIPQGKKEQYRQVLTIIKTMKSYGARLKAYRVAVGIDDEGLEKQIQQIELDLYGKMQALEGGAQSEHKA